MSRFGGGGIGGVATTPGSLRRASFAQSISDVAWYTIVDVTGSGYLLQVNGTESSNRNTEFRIRVDSDSDRVLDRPFEDRISINRARHIRFGRSVRFSSGLRVQIRYNTGSGTNTLRGSALYTLDL